MYNVVIVDDEPWALLGIKNCFDWEKYGFKLICTTTDPIEAMQVIENEKPHVIFTDICMPNLSGIDIMRNTKSLGIDSEFIIISGYSDFKYTKEAIKYGAYHYLLKPIDEIEVDQVIKSLIMKLDTKINENNNSEITNLLLNIKDNPDILRVYLLNYGFPVNSKYFQVIIIDGITSNESATIKFPKDIIYVKIYLGEGRYVFFLNSKRNILDFIHNYWIIELEFMDITIGISTLTDSINEIGNKFKEAEISVNSKFMNYENEDRIYFYSDKHDFKTINKVNELLKNMDMLNANSYSQSLSEIKQLIKSNKLGLQFITLLYNKILSSIHSIVPEIYYNVSLEPATHDQLVKNYRNIDDMFEFLNEIIKRISQNEISMKKSANKQLNKIIEYINNSFDKSLYLSDISNKFYINTNYICELFKKNLGCTFVEYVTLIRLKHAEGLLKTTNYAINKIAELSGYADYCYFGKVFKKHYGVTPITYRKNLNI